MTTYVFANMRPAVPFSFDGGAERTTLNILMGLARKGVAAIQICACQPDEMRTGANNATSVGMTCCKSDGKPEDPENGELKLRTRKEHVILRKGLLSIVAVDPAEFEVVCREVTTQVNPDLLVTWLKGSEQIVRLGDEYKIPTMLRIVGPFSHEGYPPISDDTSVLANSPVTAQESSQFYRRQIGFLLSVIDHASYVAESSTPRFITYVNPRTEKGIHLFSKIAALLPDLPLLVVRGWSRASLATDERRAMDFLASLPNVTIRPPMVDMREIYRLTSILVLPSRWQEAWARVIGEAQANGIPVIASNRGASPLSVGAGGIILDYGDPRLWANIIRTVYRDDDLRARLSDCARLNIKRFESDSLVEEYMRVLASASERNLKTPQQLTDSVGVLRACWGGRSKPQIQYEEIDLAAGFDLSEPAHP